MGEDCALDRGWSTERGGAQEWEFGFQLDSKPGADVLEEWTLGGVSLSDVAAFEMLAASSWTGNSQ